MDIGLKELPIRQATPEADRLRQNRVKEIKTLYPPCLFHELTDPVQTLTPGEQMYLETAISYVADGLGTKQGRVSEEEAVGAIRIIQGKDTASRMVDEYPEVYPTIADAFNELFDDTFVQEWMVRRRNLDPTPRNDPQNSQAVSNCRGEMVHTATTINFAVLPWFRNGGQIKKFEKR